jgi:hypothetical protein
MKTKKVKPAKDKKAELERLRLHAKYLWLTLKLHEERAAQLRRALIENGRLQDKLSASLARRSTRKKKE